MEGERWKERWRERDGWKEGEMEGERERKKVGGKDRNIDSYFELDSSQRSSVSTAGPGSSYLLTGLHRLDLILGGISVLPLPAVPVTTTSVGNFNFPIFVAVVLIGNFVFVIVPVRSHGLQLFPQVGETTG